MHRPTTALTAAALLAGLMAAGAAQAQDGPARGEGHHFGPRAAMAIDFAAIDTDADGKLSREELTTHALARITVFDLNGDGSLDAGELAAIMPAPPHAGLMRPFAPDRGARFAERVLTRMDATEAGSVAVADMAERQVNAILARLDRDHDGAISESESEARAQRRDRGPRGDDARPRQPRR